MLALSYFSLERRLLGRRSKLEELKQKQQLARESKKKNAEKEMQQLVIILVSVWCLSSLS